MMQLLCILAALLLAAAVAGGAWLLKRKEKCPKYLIPALALALGAVTVFEYMYRSVAIYHVRGVNMYSPFGDRMLQTVLAVFLVWMTYASVLLLILSAFFRYRTLQNLTKWFAPLVLLLDLVFFSTFVAAHIGTDFATVGDPRLPCLVIQLGLALGLCAVNWLEDWHLPRGREVLTMLGTLPFALLAIMPAYVPQALIGFIDPALKLYDFTEGHRFMLYLAVIIPFLIFHGLKNKDVELNRFLMIYLSLGLLFVFMGRWELADFKNPLSWPLHLCHTAMFLFPICLIFRMRRLFNFCLFVNVMGAFLAMTIPGEFDGLNALGTTRVAFWINHWAAFFIPVLLVALKIFKRPKFKEWCWAVLEFCIYFFAILFINAWLSNYGECDFFYLNSDFVASNLGEWAEKTQEMVVSFQIKELTFTFMPLYQTLFFFIYIGFTVGIWFIYALLFSMWDAAEDRREREKAYKMLKKKLTAFLGGKSIHEPVTGDSSPRLTLKHFSKKYGSNHFYSVEDVSFEVKGGEIFGFLGPNGAGKSTIIKSIVGIQPLTEGNIEICGFDVDKQAVQAKLQVGYVPDHYALYENLTGREYINYIADLYRVDREYRDTVLEKYVTRFQLVDSFDNQMKTYSHGMKQKIAIMAALVHNPKVWVLDEPLTGLDPTSVHEVKECMREHAAAGNIVFFSSHIIDVVEKICDRIAIIKKGKLRACTSVAALEDAGIELEQFYLSTIHAEEDEEPEEKAAETEAAEVSAV